MDLFILSFRRFNHYNHCLSTKTLVVITTSQHKISVKKEIPKLQVGIFSDFGAVQVQEHHWPQDSIISPKAPGHRVGESNESQPSNLTRLTRDGPWVGVSISLNILTHLPSNLVLVNSVDPRASIKNKPFGRLKNTWNYGHHFGIQRNSSYLIWHRVANIFILSSSSSFFIVK